ncbi:hypothetical protein OHA77_00840 [Streptosporangium sp. NBC_01639]|nr:hypothetical protein OHA77_00840 [Streptosporangium sp. NBC_01639]
MPGVLIHRREPYRHKALVADVMICVAGAHGYVLAPTHLSHLPKREN